MLRTLEKLLVRPGALALGVAVGVVGVASAQEGIPPAMSAESRQRQLIDQIERRLNTEALSITDPAERSLALERVAQTLMKSERLLRAPSADFEDAGAAGRGDFLADPLTRAQRDARLLAEVEGVGVRRYADALPRYQQAYDALEGSYQAAKAVPAPTLRDVRLRAASLTATRMVQQMMGDIAPGAAYRAGSAQEVPFPVELRAQHLALARRTIELAGAMAEAIAQTNFRSEMLAYVSKAESVASSQVARLLRRAEGISYERMRDVRRDFLAGLAGADNPAAVARVVARYQSGSRAARQDLVERGLLGSYPDPMMRGATRYASEIPIPIWRNRALADLVTDAAISGQYMRASEVIATMPQTAERADALIRLAEAQAMDGFADAASANYQEAVVTVASLPQLAPRQSMALVLLESLVMVNRYEDARAACTLVRDRVFRLELLGQVARAMGDNGLDQSAYAWIEAEVPPQDQSVLRRKVIDGLNDYITRGRKPRSMLLQATPRRDLERLQGY